MDGYIAVQSGILMAPGSLARIDDARGLFVYLWDGELHVTQEGDRRDHFVRAGGSFQIDRHGATLFHAVRRSVVTLMAPVPAYYARRIAVSTPGTRKQRVLYEAGGWMAGAPYRLARWWANSYARYSRPSTAAF